MLGAVATESDAGSGRQMLRVPLIVRERLNNFVISICCAVFHSWVAYAWQLYKFMAGYVTLFAVEMRISARSEVIRQI